MDWTLYDVDAHNQQVAAGKIKRDLKADSLPSRSKPESTLCNDTLGPSPREVKDPGRTFVSIVSFRCRLLDFDNLAGGCKFHLDSLRYAQLISDDNPQAIVLQVSQVKVATKQEERTEIEIVNNL